MDDIVTSLIVVLVTGVVVIGIFILNQRARKRKLLQVESLAGHNGWGFTAIMERLRSGYQLKGPNWSIEALTYVSGTSVEPQQSNVSHRTTFRSESLYLAGRNLVIGPRPARVDLGSYGTMLQDRLLQAVLGDSARGLSEVQVGSDEFLEHYMVLVNDARDAEELLTLRVQGALLALVAVKPVIKLTEQGLEVRLDQAYLSREEDIKTLVQLGEALLEVG